MENNNEFNKGIKELSNLKENIYNLRKLFDEIENDNVKKLLKEIIKISDKIYKEVVVNTNKIYKIEKFNNYYIITVEKIINKYIKLTKNKINNSESEAFFSKVEEFLKNVTISFDNLYQSLFKDEVIDIDAEIKVMEKEMKL